LSNGTENVLVGSVTGKATLAMKELLDQKNIPYRFVTYDDNKLKMIELNIRIVPVLLVYNDGILKQVLNISEIENGTL